MPSKKQPTRTYSIRLDPDSDSYFVRWREGDKHNITPNPLQLAVLRKAAIELHKNGYRRIICLRH